MSEVKEWYKNAWYTPTMKKIKDEVDGVKEDVSNVKEEVIDIRLGADGVTYSSAGDAVREQINAVISALSNFYGMATKIQSGTDFNTLNTYGAYFYPNGNYTNAPSNSGSLIVHRVSTNQFMQIALTTDNHIFTRTSADGSTWTSWEEGESELPADPSADGTYVLSCDVSSGTATKYWGVPVSPVGNDPEYRRTNVTDWIHTEITNITVS